MNVKKYITPSCTCYEVTGRKDILLTVSGDDCYDADKVKGESFGGESSDNFLWNDTKH